MAERLRDAPQTEVACDRFLLADLRRFQSGHLLGELMKALRSPPIAPSLNDTATLPMLRIGQQIATLLDFVAAHVGLSNTLIAFTADHGVAPIPELAAALGMGGGRINANDVLAAIRTAISARYNPQRKSPDPTTDYLLRFQEAGTWREWFINNNIYFNYDALKRDGVNA